MDRLILTATNLTLHRGVMQHSVLRRGYITYSDTLFDTTYARMKKVILKDYEFPSMLEINPKYLIFPLRINGIYCNGCLKGIV